TRPFRSQTVSLVRVTVCPAAGSVTSARGLPAPLKSQLLPPPLPAAPALPPFAPALPPFAVPAVPPLVLPALPPFAPLPPAPLPPAPLPDEPPLPGVSSSPPQAAARGSSANAD